MTAWEILFGWNPISNAPTKDGRYYVARLHRASGRIDIDTYDYTVQYGWNTNKYCTESPVTFEGYDAFWIPTIRISVEGGTETK